MTGETDPAASGTTPKGNRTVDIFILLGVFALWIILQIWVLPRAGVPT
jgi:hypothetical protein